MRYFYLKRIIPPFFLIILFFSCASRNDIVYYQNIESLSVKEKSNSYEIKIQPDDLLFIIVSADDVEAAKQFNLNSITLNNPTRLDFSQGQQINQLYLVNEAGYINFPVLGKMKVSGLTRTELLKTLEEKIGVYIKDPILNLRINNFKVSVLGEVNAPGAYNITSERITLIEALTMAKDLTIYGRRNNILIIREIDGVKSYNRVDITKADFINSPFYYLGQNDVVYVEPNKNKINGAAVGPNTSVIISVTSILVTLVAVTISLSR